MTAITYTYEPAEPGMDADYTATVAGEEIGGIQVAGRGRYIAGVWTTRDHDAMRHGAIKRTLEQAKAEMSRLAIEYGWVK